MSLSRSDAFLTIPLVRAAYGLPDDRLSCRACRGWLPAYLDTEMSGQSLDAGTAAVRRHLLLCQECGEIYAALLELALVEAGNKLLDVEPPTSPDLGFLDTEGGNA